MKMTSDKIQSAISRLANGDSADAIAASFNVSRHTITRLKYLHVVKNEERVRCQICGEQMKQITHRHLARHSLSLEDYLVKFQDSPTMTRFTHKAKKTFRNKNKGKTFEEIYGEKEAKEKRAKISLSQIGRPCSMLAGTGLSGTRKDTGLFARSTFEANIDRIFAIENKRIEGEFSAINPRVVLKDGNQTVTYQPDRVDVDGLFCKGAFLEVKGYMYPDDWRKLCLFRQQNQDKVLLVISPDSQYADISYLDLKSKYMTRIPLWETETQNIRTRPDLYEVGYIPSEIQIAMEKTHPGKINAIITNAHERNIAKKCLSYCAVSLGEHPLIDSVTLVAISDRRPNATRQSSGCYNYELWKVESINVLGSEHKVFWVTNIAKTTQWTCHELSWQTDFFTNNHNPILTPGKKAEDCHPLISDELWDQSNAHEKFILQLVNNRLVHRGEVNIVESLCLEDSKETKKGAHANRERWIVTDSSGCSYALSNYDGTTSEYVLNSLRKHSDDSC